MPSLPSVCSRMWIFGLSSAGCGSPTRGAFGTSCPIPSQPPWYLSVFCLSPAAWHPVSGGPSLGHTSYSSVSYLSRTPWYSLASPLLPSAVPPGWADRSPVHTSNRCCLSCPPALVTSSDIHCSWRPGQLHVDVWGVWVITFLLIAAFDHIETMASPLPDWQVMTDSLNSEPYLCDLSCLVCMFCSPHSLETLKSPSDAPGNAPSPFCLPRAARSWWNSGLLTVYPWAQKASLQLKSTGFS